MPSEKKLNISPLPEQGEDYSHYEESVVRWDRIIFAAVSLVVLLIVLITVLLSGDDQAEHSSLDEKTVLEHEVLEEQAVKSQAREGEVVVGETPEPKALEPETINAKTIDSEIKAPERPKTNNPVPALAEATDEIPQAMGKAKTEQQAKEVKAPVMTSVESESSEVLAAPQAELAVIESSQSQADVAKQDLSEQDLSPASVLIVNSAIKEAVLSLSIKNDVPGEPLKHSVNMRDQNLIKVILYTEMQGLKGKALYHEWYRDGVRQARVKIPVNVKNQRSYSSKFIDKYMQGKWQVKVIDSAGEPYILADFEVHRAE